MHLKKLFILNQGSCQGSHAKIIYSELSKRNLVNTGIGAQILLYSFISPLITLEGRYTSSPYDKLKTIFIKGLAKRNSKLFRNP